ncbi:MAG: CYTH domain-containing protein [Lentisphaeria bacterium]|nr:CYTH domain-containing protein [Lentisphaeria bacterium]
MGIEIERKFLLKNQNWRNEVIVPPENFVQGYFQRVSGGPTVRIRIADQKGIITIKGRNKEDSGIGRSEFEYLIPLQDAENMLSEFCGSRIVKKLRYRFPAGNGLFWEVDEYLDLNAGLFTAEIELPSADTEFCRPEWLGDDVSGDPRYSNGALSVKPFSLWEEQ